MRTVADLKPRTQQLLEENTEFTERLLAGGQGHRLLSRLEEKCEFCGLR